MKPYYIVITPFFPTPESFRGPYIYDQVQAIMKTGKYEVIVFKPKSWNDNRDFYEYEGVKVYLFTSFQMPSYFFNGATNKINCISFLRKIKRIGIDISNIEIAHGHTSTFGAYALALKRQNKSIKTLVQHHDRDPFTIRNGRLAHWKINARYRAKSNIQIFNQIDCHISISKVVEDNLLAFPKPGKYETYGPYLSILKQVKNLPSIQPKKSIILYNGVDTTKFYPKSGLHDNSIFKIGCIGNFQELKGQIVLIKAGEILIKEYGINNIRLSFIGSGELLESCQKYVLERGLNNYVAFETEVHHSLLVDYYNTLDLFVLPTCYEGFGCVFTEAAACGIPFMLCEHQGASEYIPTHDAGKWLFKPNDDKKLADLIYHFYQHKEKQTLLYPYDINLLVNHFLTEIND